MSESSRITNSHILDQDTKHNVFKSIPLYESTREQHDLPSLTPPNSVPDNRKEQKSSSASNQTYRDLEKSVQNNELDIYKAGEAVHNGYSRANPTVHLQVSSFVNKYAQKVFSSKLPPPQPYMDPHYLYILTHGYGIVSQLSLVASNRQKPKADAESMELGALTGAMCNVEPNITFRYPSEAPFSGQEIEFRVEMPRKVNVAAHVLIKKLLFVLLGRSCSNPTDIQTINWAIPEDAAVSRSANPIPFPRCLYDDLQTLLLHYFRIDEDILARGTYDQESCKNLKCLQGISDPNSRRSRYMILHKSRTIFMATTFHHQFKAAMADLRRSTYSPPTMGQKYGYFKLMPHGKRLRRNSGDDGTTQLDDI